MPEWGFILSVELGLFPYFSPCNWLLLKCVQLLGQKNIGKCVLKSNNVDQKHTFQAAEPEFAELEHEYHCLVCYFSVFEKTV